MTLRCDRTSCTRTELVDTYGSIKAWEKEDMVVADEPNAAGWLLPEGHNIHRRYPEVAILIPDSMGRACGGLVRFLPAHV